ncbi:hypothetical protein [Achromobacter deleyi]|uniref:hypothetical protein n=1 Tax=Achromobacter deleyi TaxID=1353891 RepID=UPI001490FCB2|nr:hypothetical protein [Achromobacter deleyi]QVQ27154.1 hypothetical protein HLG70_01465 [Achromobacter deleyi]UIP22742.1 hypothetical protein LYZ39_09570 [Achromobacter deleyi]
MSSTYRELLDAAVSISAAGETEGLYRATASRAYYAAYHAARTYHNGLSSPGSLAYARGGMHEGLYTQLRTPTVANPRIKAQSIALGNLLMAAYALRVQADYMPEKGFPAMAGMDALDKARMIVDATESSTPYQA